MHKTITAFFSGSGFEIDDQRFLAANLYDAATADESHLTFGFSGCGIDYGLMGMLFGVGLDKQCKVVIDAVLKELSAGNGVTLNVYGHSRGAVAGLLIAEQLAMISPMQLEINLSLSDPVPGNLITTGELDFLEISLANRARNLTNCKPLKRVQALYLNQPFPAYYCHAPLFANFPKDIELTEEVLPGFHAYAEQPGTIAGSIAKHRVTEFLNSCGSSLMGQAPLNSLQLVDLYQGALDKHQGASSRAAHSSDSRYIETKESAMYFNRQHAGLLGDPDSKDLLVTIKRSTSPLAVIKRALIQFMEVTYLKGALSLLLRPISFVVRKLAYPNFKFAAAEPQQQSVEVLASSTGLLSKHLGGGRPSDESAPLFERAKEKEKSYDPEQELFSLTVERVENKRAYGHSR